MCKIVTWSNNQNHNCNKEISIRSSKTLCEIGPSLFPTIGLSCPWFVRKYMPMVWHMTNAMDLLQPSLKWKCLHFDEIFITGYTGSCQNDNFQCSQWWKFHQNINTFIIQCWTKPSLYFLHQHIYSICSCCCMVVTMHVLCRMQW